MLDTGGIGTYLAELLPRIVASMDEARFTLLGDEALLRRLLPASSRVAIRPFDVPIYSVREQLAFVGSIPRDTTLFWSPHFNIPLGFRGPLAVTVHDVAHLALPQSSLARRAYATWMFSAVRRRAAIVFCDSAFTAAEFTRRVGAPRELKVCHLGVAPRWFEPDDTSPPLGEPYFLYVGNVKPHKNLGRLLDAFAGVAPATGHRLVIVGRRDGMRTIDHHVAERAAALGECIVYTGYVSPEALERYVRGCDALVLPSLYEGFGLPPLEALACGRAVAVSNAASLPEVCGPVAEYFDPLDETSIAAALIRLAHRAPDSADVIARRRDWARRFDWETCATATVAGFRRAMAAHDGHR